MKSRPVLLLAALLPSFGIGVATWSRMPVSLQPLSWAPFLRDFTSLWVSSRLYLAGRAHDVADLDAFQSAIAHLVGPTRETYVWFYPPQTYLLTTPFATLPVLPAFLLWTAVTLLLLALALRATGLPHAGLALLSPAAAENLLDGHNGALVTASILGALALPARSPMLAGLCLSVLTIKPQLAILVPIALLAAWQWRTLAWGAGFAALWGLLSVLCFGTQPWVDYVTLSVPAARQFLLTSDAAFGARFFEKMMVTPYALLRGLGVGVTVAEQFNLITAAAAIAATAWFWRARSTTSPHLKLAFLLAAIPLVTPNALTYDMIGPSLACLILATEPPRTSAGTAIAATGWLWPGLAAYVAVFLHQPGLGALAYAALAAIIAHQALVVRT